MTPEQEQKIGVATLAMSIQFVQSTEGFDEDEKVSTAYTVIEEMTKFIKEEQGFYIQPPSPEGFADWLAKQPKEKAIEWLDKIRETVVKEG